MAKLITGIGFKIQCGDIVEHKNTGADTSMSCQGLGEMVLEVFGGVVGQVSFDRGIRPGRGSDFCQGFDRVVFRTGMNDSDRDRVAENLVMLGGMVQTEPLVGDANGIQQPACTFRTHWYRGLGCSGRGSGLDSQIEALLAVIDELLGLSFQGREFFGCVG